MKNLSVKKKLQVASAIVASILLLTHIMPVIPTLAFDPLSEQSSEQEEVQASSDIDAELDLALEDETDQEDPVTEPAQVEEPESAATEPHTEPTTEARSAPATESTTIPTSQHETEPATEPVTEPVTEPTTEAVTIPTSEHEAEQTTTPTTPTTQTTTPATPSTTVPTTAKTEPATEPPTTPVTESPTTPATMPATEAATPQTTQPSAPPTEPTSVEPEMDNAVVETPDTVDYTDAGPFLNSQATLMDATPPPNMGVNAFNTSSINAIDGRETFSNGIGMGKYILHTTDPDQRTLRLETYTSGTVTSDEVGIPLDIMLVLDVSGSMAYDFHREAGNSNQRYNALKSSVTNFINEVHGHADEFDVTHRIGIVSYSTNVNTIINMQQLRTAAQRNSIRNTFNSNLPTPNGATRIDLGTERGVSLLNGVSSSLPSDPQGVTRGRVMIVFTDGAPTSSFDYDINVATRAIEDTRAIKHNTTVYTVGIFSGANPAEMYGSTGFATVSNGTIGSRWTNTIAGSWFGVGQPSPQQWIGVEVPAVNRFMNLLSSNSNNASTLGLSLYNQTRSQGGTTYRDYGYQVNTSSAKDRNGYYLSASDATSLNAVFQSIVDSISAPTIELPTSTTEIRDTLTEQFKFPAGFSPANVRVSTYESLGKDGSGNWIFSNTPTASPNPHLNGVTVTVDGKAVVINGYNFNANYVTEDPKDGAQDRGRKLVFEFEIEREPTFFGGNSVPTNAAHAGIFNKTVGTAYATFPRVITNPRLKFDYSVANQAIYLGNLVDLAESVTFLTDASVPYKPDGANNAYADIEYSLYDGTELLAVYTVPAGTDLTAGGGGIWSQVYKRPTINKAYEVKVTVKPSLTPQTSEQGVVNLSIGPRDLGVEIYRPKINADDTTIYYGETLDMTALYTTEFDGTTYTDPSRVHPVTWHRDMTGPNYTTDLPAAPPPQVDFRKPDKMDLPAAYDLAAFTPEQDTPFRLDVHLIAFEDHTLTPLHLNEASTDGRHAAPNSDFNFNILLRYLRLTVEKQMKQGEHLLDPNQTFIFEVKRTHSGQTSTWLIAIQGVGSRSLTGLPVGTYQVTELTEWSWRYTPDQVSKSATLSKTNHHATVVFKNKLTDDQWLSGDSSVVNIFDAVAPRPLTIGGVSDEDKKKP